MLWVSSTESNFNVHVRLRSYAGQWDFDIKRSWTSEASNRKFTRSHSFFSPTTIMRDPNPYELRAKYTRFRILVIGRANAGKTTLLQRVCNTTEDPCIYDENNKNLVSAHRSEDEFYF